MKNALREFRTRLFLPTRLAGIAAATLICGISGPFRTLEFFGPVTNVFFWFTAIVLATAISVALDQCFSVLFKRLAWYYRLTVQAVVFSLICGVLIVFVDRNYFHHLLGRELTVAEVAFQLGLIYLAIKVLIHIAKDMNRRAEAATFLKRLPPALGRNLIRVTSQDHYLEVSTDKGSDRILMRFSDAMDELGTLDGLRVHRSHWVMRSAIEDVVTGDGKVLLRLKDGSEIPVSRTYRDSLSEAGLL